MNKNYSRFVWGIAFILLGIIFTGNVLNLWSIDVFFPGWWTLFLIVPGLVSILKDGFNTGNMFLIILGLFLLFDRLDLISSRILWRLIGPLVLIAIGISIIASPFKKKVINDTGFKESQSFKYDETNYPHYKTILGGGDFKNNCQNLKGIVADAILGGLDIDLRDAKITEDIVFELNAVLGGIDIFIPDNVDVEIISGIPVLGGFEHKIKTVTPGAPKIRIKYVAVLGGIEIK